MAASSIDSVVVKEFTTYARTVAACMRQAGAARLLTDKRPVMLKPNLVTDSPYPVTTPVELCEAVIAFVREHVNVPIVIAEGCGDALLETSEVFELNGYRSPDFTVMDATIGLADDHLGGAHCVPPTNRIVAGADARAVDRRAAALLGMDWQRVGHLV